MYLITKARKKWLDRSIQLFIARARGHWFAILLLIGTTGALVGITAAYAPPGIDWHQAFRPAALELLHFHNPYAVSGFLNPPWTLLVLLPLAVLPENIGRAVLLLLNLGVLSFVARRLGANALVLGAFLVSPIVLHGLLNASMDWMVLLGFVLPPQIGLFFVTIKPQVGGTVALFWLVESWRKGGKSEVIRVFWPVSVVFLASLVAFGPWPLRFGQPVNDWWNASLWPLSIPVGLALLVISFRKHNAKYAMGAAPCLSPYVLLHSWVGALIALAELPLEMTAAVAGLWLVVILRAFG